GNAAIAVVRIAQRLGECAAGGADQAGIGLIPLPAGIIGGRSRGRTTHALRPIVPSKQKQQGEEDDCGNAGECNDREVTHFQASSLSSLLLRFRDEHVGRRGIRASELQPVLERRTRTKKPCRMVAETRWLLPCASDKLLSLQSMRISNRCGLP